MAEFVEIDAKMSLEQRHGTTTRPDLAPGGQATLPRRAPGVQNGGSGPAIGVSVGPEAVVPTPKIDARLIGPKKSPITSAVGESRAGFRPGPSACEGTIATCLASL